MGSEMCIRDRISAQWLGEDALEAFNRLSTDAFFGAVPAILVTGPQQQELAAQARVDERRKTIVAPIRPAEVTELLEAIIVRK